MSFELLPQQRQIWQCVQGYLARESLPSAFLCWGVSPDKPAFVRRLTAMLLCPSQQPPCGRCSSCHQYVSHHHPDCFELGQNTAISVEQVRQISMSLYHSATLLGRRVMVLWQAQTMSLSAVNALLKIVEEPPEQVHFIFVVDHPHQLPLTLLSRCHRLKIDSLYYKKQTLKLEIDHMMRLGDDLLALARGKKTIADLTPTWFTLEEERLLKFLWLWHLDSLKLTLHDSDFPIDLHFSLKSMQSYVRLVNRPLILSIIDSLGTQYRAIFARRSQQAARWISDILLQISHG